MDKNSFIAPIIEHNPKKFVKDLHRDLIKDAAKRCGFTYHYLANLISKITTDKGDIYFYDFIAPSTPISSQYACSNKWITKYFLKKANINTPNEKLFSKNEIDKAWQWVKSLNKIVVIKPTESIHSKGITLNIKDKKEFEIAWENASKYSNSILVEEMVKGKDYRVVIIDGKYVAATAKATPKVKGDGIHTVLELIEKRNIIRKQNPHTRTKPPIKITPEISKHLNTQSITADTILQKDKLIELSPIPNVSAGGTHKDITDFVHSDFINIVQKVSKVLPKHGHIAVDILAGDLTKPAKNQIWNILEVNESLSLPHNHFPLIGKSRDVAKRFIETSYKSLKPKDINSNKTISKIAPKWNQKDSNYHTKGIKKDVILRAAYKRNLKVIEVDKYFWYLLHDSGRYHSFKYIMPDLMSTVAQKLTAFKHLSLTILKNNGIKTPNSKSFLLGEEKQAWQYAKGLKSEIVIKPYTGTGGNGVFLNIKDEQNFYKAISKQGENRFLVERQIKGNDYRMLAIDGKFVASSIRTPANIIGDGIHTIKKLIDIKNQKRLKNPYSATKLAKISYFVQKELQEQNISLDTILPKDKKIYIQKVANVSAGGDNKDTSEQTHIGFQKIAVDVLNSYPDLFMCGIDIIAEDLSKDPNQQNWAVIEVNANPDLQMHHFPIYGQKRDVAGVLIDSLFKDIVNKTPAKIKTLKLIVTGNITSIDLKTWINYEAHKHALNGSLKVIDNKLEIIISGMPNAIDDFIKKCSKRKRDILSIVVKAYKKP